MKWLLTILCTCTLSSYSWSQDTVAVIASDSSVAAVFVFWNIPSFASLAGYYNPRYNDVTFFECECPTGGVYNTYSQASITGSKFSADLIKCIRNNEDSDAVVSFSKMQAIRKDGKAVGLKDFSLKMNELPELPAK